MNEEHIKVVLETNAFAESLVLKALELGGVDTSSVSQQEHPDTSDDTVWLEFWTTSVAFEKLKRHLKLIKETQVRILKPSLLPDLSQVDLQKIEIREITAKELGEAFETCKEEVNKAVFNRLMMNQRVIQAEYVLQKDHIVEILSASDSLKLGIRGIGEGNWQKLKQVLVLILQNS